MHDRDGQPLKVGDKVFIHATVTETHDPGSEYCNVKVVTDIPMADRTVRDTIVLNAKQVVKFQILEVSGSCVVPDPAAVPEDGRREAPDA